MNAKIWTFTDTNVTLVHAFHDGRALCNKGIRPRTLHGTPTYKTLEDAADRAMTTACERCRTKVNQHVNDIAKADKLSPAMVTAIRLTGQNDTSDIRTGTIVALINRGILTTATLGTEGRHLLTAKGADVYRELTGSDPHSSTCEVPRMNDSEQSDKTGEFMPERPVDFVALVGPNAGASDKINLFVPISPDGTKAWLSVDHDRIVNLVDGKIEADRITAQRELERARYAKTVATMLHGLHMDRLGTYGLSIDRFANSGTIDSDLLYGITYLMTSVIPNVDIQTMGDQMGWAGWLYAYVLEAGTVDAHGWQQRERDTVDGWDSLPLYDLDPESVSDLPAWADRNNEEETVCKSWHYLGYGEKEACGERVSRDGYYATIREQEQCDTCINAKVREERDL